MHITSWYGINLRLQPDRPLFLFHQEWKEVSLTRLNNYRRASKNSSYDNQRLYGVGAGPGFRAMASGLMPGPSIAAGNAI
jgi:hypothetical protein